MSRQAAVLVSNVKHIRHQLDALAEMDFDVHLFGLRLFEPRKLALLAQNPLLRPVSRVLSRRQGTWPTYATFHGLGPGTYTPILQAKLPIPEHPRIALAHILLQRAMVQAHLSRLPRPKLLHTLEGLSPKVDVPRVHRLVVERRSLHPDDMRSDVEPVGGFPLGRHVPGVARPLGIEFDQADAIIVYSDLARDSMAKHGVPQEKLNVVHIPMALPDSPPPPNTPTADPTFLFVGVCQIYKGVDVAVEATGYFKGEAQLRIAGHATDLVRTWLDTKPHVDHLGMQSKEDIASELRTATAFVMPSRESLGLAVLEAIRARVPCVISSETGVASILRRHAPELVVEGRDPQAWFERLDWVARLSLDERARLTERSYQVLHEFAHEHGVASQRAVYESVL